MNPRLIATAGPLQGSVFLIAGSEWSVGRSAANQLFLRDAAVSRNHCLFRPSADGFVLLDTGSHNGTYVNGERVEEKILSERDEIQVGGSTFRFVTGEAGDEPSSKSSRDTIVALRPEDSIYLASQESEEGLPSSSRANHDMRLLVRLSTVLHSLKALYGSHDQRAQEALSNNLMALLMDIIPAGQGGVLARSADLSIPYTVIAKSSDAFTVDAEILQEVAHRGIAVMASPEVPGPPNAIASPVVVRDEVEAVLYFSSGARRFDEGHLQLLTAVAGMAAVAWENASMVEWLRQENERLLRELNIDHGMVGESVKMRDLHKQIARVAPSNSTVLILGESGTGKELIARAIHRNSARPSGPFIAINCAALTETLVESELFGYEKGAFTGALAQRKGKLESAEGGTVFLDEIGELSLPLQAKLLRVLQERELQRVGGTENVKLDIRLVAATNRDLGESAKKGEFRQDLYYRLNVVSLKAPPLRQRPEDILGLAEHFARKFASQCGRKLAGISPQARTLLQSYSWPGNVRELENAVERAVVLGVSDTILPEDLPEQIHEERPAEVSATLYEEAIETAKRQVVLRAFELAAYDHETAARLLGLHPNYLHRLIRSLEMKPALKTAAKSH